MWHFFRTLSASSCDRRCHRMESIPRWYNVSPIIMYCRALYQMRRLSELESSDEIFWVWRYRMMSPYQRSEVSMRKRVSSGIKFSATNSVLGEGSRQMSSTKTNDFLDLAFSNSRSNSWRVTIHFEYSPLALV